jgi:hypothetical protein
MIHIAVEQRARQAWEGEEIVSQDSVKIQEDVPEIRRIPRHALDKTSAYHACPLGQRCRPCESRYCFEGGEEVDGPGHLGMVPVRIED